MNIVSIRMHSVTSQMTHESANSIPYAFLNIELLLLPVMEGEWTEY